jgi:ribosomal protein L1
MLICILISSKFRSVVSWRITNVSTSSQCITSNLLKFMRRLDVNVSNSTRNQYLWNS